MEAAQGCGCSPSWHQNGSISSTGEEVMIEATLLFISLLLGALGYFTARHLDPDPERSPTEALWRKQVSDTLAEISSIQTASWARYGVYFDVVGAPGDLADVTCACPNNTPFTYRSTGNTTGYIVTAEGNLDDDPDLEVWIISESQPTPTRLVED